MENEVIESKESKKTSRKGSHIAFMGGTYSLIITAVVLAILIMVNVLVCALPTTYTKYDISSSQLYSITANTKVVVNNLTEDVTIYWIVQADQEDDIIENLLSRYEALSDHIKVVKKNPDVYPTFAESYTEDTVTNNSLVVECGDRYRYIAYDDIYVTDADVYSYYYTTSFDGEGAITSAIDYVVTDDLPVMYTLEGHGESELPSTFAESVEKANIEVQTLSLMMVDEIPEDADVIMIYAPTSDISEDEKDMLSDYVENGGKLMVVSGPVEDTTLTTLNSILEDYEIEVVDGIVVEEERDYYAWGYPYMLIPVMYSDEITDSLIDDSYYAIMPVAQGLNVSAGSTATKLLVTSDTAFSKAAGYELTTYEKEDGDTDGPFTLAVSIETDNEGGIIWFTSSDFLEDMYNAYSSGANADLAMNALSSLVGEREALAIRSKSLNYSYLTISSSTSSTLKTLMIGILPLIYLCIGIAVVVYRKKVQNEAV